MKLETQFAESILCLTGNEIKSEKLWRDIEKRYTHSSRHYHSLHHLHHLTNTLMQVKTSIVNWDVLVLAIAYHDIIYNTRKNNNEEKSAEYADNILSGMISKENRELLSQFILATKAHQRSENEDINYFTDADLSILGASPDEYNLYTEQIRNEYKLYPLFIYKPGRAKVIRHFLNMITIFKTSFFQNMYEKKARKNLQTELDELNR